MFLLITIKVSHENNALYLAFLIMCYAYSPIILFNLNITMN